jgi:hypothetical protein
MTAATIDQKSAKKTCWVLGSARIESRFRLVELSSPAGRAKEKVGPACRAGPGATNARVELAD